MSESEEADVVFSHNMTAEETKSNTANQLSMTAGAGLDQTAAPLLHKIQEDDCENELSFQ